MNRAAAIAASTLLAGVAAWQAPMNARLAESVGAMPASVVSFLVSVAFLLCVALVVDGPRRLWTLPSEVRRTDPRHLIGGLLGASYVVVAVLTVGALGTGGLMGASVAGTLVGAVGIDWAGILGVRRQAPGLGRVVGVFLLLGGTVLINSHATFNPVALVAVFGVGLMGAFQPPVNARLAARLGGARAALTQSTIGTVALASIALAAIPFEPSPGGGSVPWWGWAGGVLGALYVVSTLASVPHIGAGGVAAASIAGGLAFAAAADQLGLFGLDPVSFDLPRAAALAALGAGAALVLRRHDP